VHPTHVKQLSLINPAVVHNRIPTSYAIVCFCHICRIIVAPETCSEHLYSHSQPPRPLIFFVKGPEAHTLSRQDTSRSLCRIPTKIRTSSDVFLTRTYHRKYQSRIYGKPAYRPRLCEPKESALSDQDPRRNLRDPLMHSSFIGKISRSGVQSTNRCNMLTSFVEERTRKSSRYNQ
jgi:hypothetical protein